MKTWNFISGWPRTNRSPCEHGGSELERGFRNRSSHTLLAACVAGFISNSYAAEDVANDEMPDLEFLEFLGQFETDAGEWIDPGSLQTEELSELLEISALDEADDESTVTDDTATNDP